MARLDNAAADADRVMDRSAPPLAFIAAGIGAGIGAFLFLIIAQRAHGTEAVAPLTQLWSWWALCFAALSLPTQQGVVRIRLACSDDTRIGPLIVAMVLAVFGTVLVAVEGATVVFRDGHWAWPATAALLIPLNHIAGGQRGLAAANEERNRQLVQLAGENMTRVVAAAALTVASAPVSAYAAALLAGYLVYVPGIVRGNVDGYQRTTTAAPGATRYRTYLRSAVFGGCSHGMLVLAPGLLALSAITTIELGQLFMILALLRAPYQVSLALVPRLAVGFERAEIPAWLTNPFLVFGAVPVALAAGFIAPPILRLYLGEDLVGDGAVPALATLITLAAIVNLVWSVRSTMLDGGFRLVPIWVLGFAIAIGGIATTGAVVPGLIAIVAAEAVVLALLVWSRATANAAETARHSHRTQRR